MKKLLAVSVIFLFFGMVIFPSTAIQIYNKPIKSVIRGNTLYVGGSGPGNYTTIRSAVENATNGTTVLVYDDSSPYNEWHIDIDKSINLIGENKETTIVDGNGTTIFRIVVDNVHITGFYIQNSEARGIRIYSDFNNISDNIFYNVNEGLDFTSSDYNMIYRNTIKQTTCGITLSSSNNNIISENNLPGWHHVGIIVGGSHNIISGNILDGSYYRGISLGSSNNTITKNYITRAGFVKGEMTAGAGIYCYNGNNIKITKNEVINCEYGMQLNIWSSLIEDNIIINNDWKGIDIHHGDNNLIKGNIIKENKNMGLIIYYSESNKVIGNAFINNTNWNPLIFIGGNRNIIEKNNFIGNLGDAYFENSWGNRWSKNYWDECYNGWIYFIYGIWEIYDPWDMDPNKEPIRTIHYYNADFRPARKPYEIPDTSYIQGCGIE